MPYWAGLLTRSGDEVVDANYARQPVTFEVTNATSARNINSLQFFYPGASKDHEITECAVYDSPTGGFRLRSGSLTGAERTVVGSGVHLFDGSLVYTYAKEEKEHPFAPKALRRTAWEYLLEGLDSDG